jgi:peroxiredoxin
MSRLSSVLACLALLALLLPGCGSDAESPVAAADGPPPPAVQGEPVPGKVFPAEEETPPPAEASGWIGRRAPDFLLPGLDGTLTRLSEVEESLVVLEWTSHICSFAKRHYARSNVQSLVKTYGPRGVAWFAIDSSMYPISHPIKVQRWIDQRSIRHPILLDKTGVVGEAYGVKTTPTVVILQKGVIVYYGPLDDDVWGRKSAPRHHVAEALQALLAGEPVPEATPKTYGSPIRYLADELERRAAREAALPPGGPPGGARANEGSPPTPPTDGEPSDQSGGAPTPPKPIGSDPPSDRAEAPRQSA